MESSKNRKVILDTSILMAIFENKFDIQDEILREVGLHSIVVPESVLIELHKLAELGRGKKKKYSKAALDYLKRNKFEIIHSENKRNVDDDIVLLAKRLNAMVATTDKQLMERLKGECIGILRLKKRRLELL